MGKRSAGKKAAAAAAKRQNGSRQPAVPAPSRSQATASTPAATRSRSRTLSGLGGSPHSHSHTRASFATKPAVEGEVSFPSATRSASPEALRWSSRSRSRSRARHNSDPSAPARNASLEIRVSAAVLNILCCCIIAFMGENVAHKRSDSIVVCLPFLLCTVFVCACARACVAFLDVFLLMNRW